MLRAIFSSRVSFLIIIAAVLAIFARCQSRSISASAAAETTVHDTLAAQILCATARYEIDYWAVKPNECGYVIDTAIGHGTVKEGRYLVTHNHFRLPFSGDPSVDAAAIYGQVQIYTAAGNKLAELPYDRVNIVLQDEETLILDFGERDGVGFFETLGFSSAEFLNWHDALLTPHPLAPRAELAQVDWDGREARVDWSTVLAVDTVEGVARLVIDDPLMLGSSGGGVFWNGYHLANNWTAVTVYDNTGTIIGGHSTAALDSSQIATFQSEARETHTRVSLANFLRPSVSQIVGGTLNSLTDSPPGAVVLMPS